MCTITLFQPQGDEEVSALHIAAITGASNITQHILSNNNNAHEAQTENDQLTPLHFAAIYGNVEVARQLLDSNADPNARNTSGYTPVHMAVISDKQNTLQVLKVLLENEGKPNAFVEPRELPQIPSPLHQAVHCQYPQKVTTLLDNGANPHIQPNQFSQTPLNYTLAKLRTTPPNDLTQQQKDTYLNLLLHANTDLRQAKFDLYAVRGKDAAVPQLYRDMYEKYISLILHDTYNAVNTLLQEVR